MASGAFSLSSHSAVMARGKVGGWVQVFLEWSSLSCRWKDVCLVLGQEAKVADADCGAGVHVPFKDELSATEGAKVMGSGWHSRLAELGRWQGDGGKWKRKDGEGESVLV